MIIDFHTHIFPPEITRKRAEYLAHDPVFNELYSDQRAKMVSVEDLIRNMDDQQVDRCVVQNFQWSDPRACHLTNQYIIESVNRYPARLNGFGMICFSSIPAALEEIEYCAANGLKGIGEIRPSSAILADPDGLRPIIQSLISHNLVVCTHSSEPLGHLYSGKGDITPQLLYPLIAAFPDLKLVCSHWGGGLPFYAMMPEVAKALRNVYFDSAASPYLYQPRIYEQAASLVGIGHILFGSDFPLLKPRRLIKEIESSNLSETDKNRILGLNTRTLLGL